MELLISLGRLSLWVGLSAQSLARMRTLLLLCCLAMTTGFMAIPASPSPAPLSQRSAAAAICMGAPTKATRVNIRNREYNKKYKSEMRTRVKSVRVPHPRDCPDRLPHVPVQRRSSQRCRLSAGRWWLAAVPD